MTVRVDVEVVEVQGRKIVFKVSAHDAMDLIGEGRAHAVVGEKPGEGRRQLRAVLAIRRGDLWSLKKSKRFKGGS